MSVIGGANLENPSKPLNDERIGILIIGNLNRDGYLVMDPEAEPTIPALGDTMKMVSPQGVGADVELLSVFHRLGVRMVSFTHWSRALLAEGSADEETGSRLPAAGVHAVAELERLGFLLDVSHLAAASVDHVLELATRTVVATHSCARALRDHHRNLSDEHLRAIAATGGVIGMNVLPNFVDGAEPTLDRVVDHLEHMAGVAGIDHVGLGPDFLREYMDAIYPQFDEVRRFGGVDLKAVVPGLARERDLPNLTERLFERGWAETDARKVLGESWLRVFRTLT